MELPLTYEIVYQVNSKKHVNEGFQTFAEALEVFENAQGPVTLTQITIKTILTKEGV